MEPVFAGYFAVIIGGDHLTVRIIIGGACVLAAMFIISLKAKPYVRMLEPQNIRDDLTTSAS